MNSEALAEFENWFTDNYPADCIISKPAWHAPKIYRAATYVMERENKTERAKLMNVISGLMGLVQLIGHGDGKDYTTNHRYVDAAALLAKLIEKSG